MLRIREEEKASPNKFIRAFFITCNQNFLSLWRSGNIEHSLIDI